MALVTESPIDLTKISPPDAIESLSFEEIFSASIADLKARLVAAGVPWDMDGIETDPLVILEQARSYRELILRARVNDAVRSVLVPTATGANLDNVVARQGIQRLTLQPANPIARTPAVMESDANLRRRYLLSFERPSAGSAARYEFEALTAFPAAGHVLVNGRAVHGRRGDTDIVVTGPGGRTPTPEELAAVTAAVLKPTIVPEAVALAVLPAERVEYAVRLRVAIPPGPDADVIVQDVRARVRAAADARTQIGAEIPAGLLPGAAYGANIIRVTDLQPVTIAANRYKVPVCTEIQIEVERL